MAVRVARGNRVSSRRGVLLLGSALGVSIAVLAAAVPNRALAADECGVAAPGATLTCAAGEYPTGIEYLGAEDLTVVLPADATVSGENPSGAAVAVRGTGNLTLTAQEGSTVQNDDGEGVWVDSYDGAAVVTVDNVTAGNYAVDIYGATSATVTATGTVQTAGGYAVFAISGGDVTVNAADIVVTGGIGGAGVFAFSTSTGGSVSVTSGAIEASGTGTSGIRAFAWREGSTITVDSGSITSDGDGIYAYSGEGGHADIVIDSATVSTSGDDGRGIFASASYGDVTVYSGSVTTLGAGAEGIRVNAPEGDVMVVSDLVDTAGDYADGIDIDGGSGVVQVDSGVVSTTGRSASGIDVYTTSGGVTVTSGSVSVTGGRSSWEGPFGTYYGPRPAGIDVRSYSGDVSVTSGDVTVVDGLGISVETAGAISITSTGQILVQDGESGGGAYAAGIHFDSNNLEEGVPGGTVNVTNAGRIEIHGSDRYGIYGYGSGGDMTIANTGAIVGYGTSIDGVRVHNEYDGALAVVNGAGGSIHLYDANSTGLHAGTEDGALTITNVGSIVTEGDYSDAINFHSERGAVSLTSTGTIETSGYGSGAIYGHSYDGDVLVDVVSVQVAGGSASGIDVWSRNGSVTVNADLVVTGSSCGEGEGCFGGADSFGVRATNATGNVTIDVGSVTTGDHHAVGVSAGMYGGFLDADFEGEGEYAFGDIQVTAGSVTTSGDWAAGVQVVSGLTDWGPFGPPPIARTGDVSVDAGTIVTHGDGSAGISVAGGYAEDVLGFWAGPMLGGGGVDPLALIMGPHFGAIGDVEVDVDSISTDGDGAVGVYASSGFTLGFYGEGEYTFSQPGGDVVVTSGEITTAGDGAIGIVGRALAGGVTIDSGVIETSGDDASGIVANSGGVVFTSAEVEPEVYFAVPTFVAGGLIDITSDGIYTSGESAAGITVVGLGGGVQIDSGVIDTQGAYANGIQVMALGGDVSVESDLIIARGDEAGGIMVSTANLDPFFGGDGFTAGDIHVTSGTIRTEGGSADGIAVFSGYAFFGEGEYGGGDIDVTSGSVTTLGDGSAGIRVSARGHYTFGDDESVDVHGDVTVHSGAVTTAGRYSDGVNIWTDYGSVDVTATGVTTTGVSSRGIDIDSVYGDVVINAGTVTTSGDRASEVVSHYDSYTESTVYETIYGNASDGVRVTTQYGDVTINAQNVTVSGDHATGVLVDSEYGDVTLNLGTVRALGEAGDGVRAYAYDGDVNVTVTGMVSAVDGTALWAGSYYGDVNVNVNAARATGEFTSAVAVNSVYGDAHATVGSVQAFGQGVNGVSVQSIYGDVGVTVTGTTTSAQGAGVVASAGEGAVDVTLASGSVVRGATGIWAYSATGTTITIRGSVEGTDGYAIDVNGLGAATIHNLSNTVIGGVSLTDFDDVFDNTGTFKATIDSQFGEGADVFDNTGLLEILPGSGTPGTIVFHGLETFDNAGVVDLANGHVGDVFDLSSATWNGLAGSTLEMDVSATGSDTLLVDDATGQTTIVLHGSGVGIGDAFDLVVSNSDETGDEFVLGGDGGFLSFALNFDAATDTWSVTGAADTEVFEPGRFLAGAQNFWHETGDAWSARMTELRDARGSREGVQGWAQVFRGEQSEDRGTERFTVGGATSDVNLAYEQTYRGVQTGVDWAAGDAVLGLTVGFGDSDQVMASGNSANFQGYNLGGYGGWNAGSFFLNGLVKADFYKARLGLRTLGDKEELAGRTLGAKAEAGWRVGGDGWFFEPAARLAWTDVDLDGFSTAGGTVEFGDASSLLGEAGARVGVHWANGVVDLVPYVGLFAVDEFDGGNQTAFSIAGDTFRLTDEAAGAHGRADFGVTAVTFHGLEGFVKGEALFGGDAEGYSARLGVRWRW